MSLPTSTSQLRTNLNIINILATVKIFSLRHITASTPTLLNLNLKVQSTTVISYFALIPILTLMCNRPLLSILQTQPAPITPQHIASKLLQVLMIILLLQLQLRTINHHQLSLIPITQVKFKSRPKVKPITNLISLINLAATVMVTWRVGHLLLTHRLPYPFTSAQQHLQSPLSLLARALQLYRFKTSSPPWLTGPSIQSR